MARLSATERREALIEAALRVMERDGLTAGTTRAIVAEAGMSLASFHYAFASREDLLRELVQRVIGRELASAMGEWSPADGLAACLRAAADGYLAHLESSAGQEQLMLELTLLAVRRPDLHPIAREQYRSYVRAATQLLELAAELTGAHWRRPLPELARLLITLVDGATTTWLVDRDTAATRAVFEAAVDLFVDQHAEQSA
jgi:TetR/AcrR family transcriptional regulator, regulator of biofilm formation and stress response